MMEGKNDNCTQFSDFMHTQIDIIKRHLPEHVWYRHLDDSEAMKSFIAEYGWLIREMYCGHVCEDRGNCMTAERFSAARDLERKLNPRNPGVMECSHLTDLLEAEEVVLARHIDNHKWFQQIADSEEAVRDFLHRYEWLMRETYCLRGCPTRADCAHAHTLIDKKAG